MNIKYAFMAAAFVGAVCATPALADTWSAVYDGTIVSTYSDGRVVDVYVNADHTYSIKDATGKEVVKGTWADGDKGSCFTPDGGGAPLCFPVKEYKIGDSFEGEDSSGKFTGLLKAGR